MSNKHLRDYASRGAETPQRESAREDQIENAAGGHGWAVDDLTRLRRFLILGAEGGTYYAGERQLVRENAKALDRLLVEDGIAAVELIREVSKRGLAPRNDTALFALALATTAPDVDVRREAWRSLPDVARTGSHLFSFVSMRDAMAGWGRGAKRAVGRWYSEAEPARLAYQLVKYRQREGWTHRDVLRVAHPKAPSEGHATLYDWLCGRTWPEAIEQSDELEMLEGFLRAQRAQTPAESADLIDQYGLPREAILTDHLADKEVWQALLENGMPMTAMIRNLATMTRVGVLAPMSAGARIVADQLVDENLRSARVHPISILSALRTYASGHSVMGRGQPWAPVASIVDALDAAFYASFGFIEPANKRTLLALDASGSMTMHDIAGITGLKPREGAAAMALATLASEPETHTVAFSGPYHEGRDGWGRTRTHMTQQQAMREEGLTPIHLSPRQRLEDAVETLRSMPFGATDCAGPMIYAQEKGIPVDTFVIYTDNETQVGAVHPFEALKSYRRETGIAARLAVVGMTATGFTLADPRDAGMIDLVGFDASAPALLSAFSRGEV